MAKQPPPAQVTRKVTLSHTTTPPAAVSTNVKYEHVVQLSSNGDYEDEKVLVQGNASLGN